MIFIQLSAKINTLRKRAREGLQDKKTESQKHFCYTIFAENKKNKRKRTKKETRIVWKNKANEIKRVIACITSLKMKKSSTRGLKRNKLRQ